MIGAGAAGQPLNQAFGRRASTTTIIGVSTNYNSLQAKLNRRFQNGFQVTTSYTYSKAIDYCSDRVCTPYNQYEFRRNRARSDFDHTQVYVQSAVYELPIGQGKKWLTAGRGGVYPRRLAGNGVFTAQTGGPMSIQYSNAGLNAPFINNRPNVNGPVGDLRQGKIRDHLVRHERLFGAGQRDVRKRGTQRPDGSGPGQLRLLAIPQVPV